MLPLLVRDLAVVPARPRVVTAGQRGRSAADGLGVRFAIAAPTPDNLHEVMGKHLRAGDFLLDLSVEVDSLELLQFATRQGALYLDAGIEPWLGGYADPTLSPGQRSSPGFRAKALALSDRIRPGRPTAASDTGN